MTGFTEEPLTMTLAEWAAATQASDLSDNVRHQVARGLIDYLAAAMIGSTTDTAIAVREFLASQGSGDASAVIGTRTRLSPSDAAAANGTAAHALDVDDGYTPGGLHPSAPIISAVLATAEAITSSPDDIVHAIAVGTEVSCRLAEAGHPAQRKRGFHNTALVGVFGAATAVAVLHGLDAATIAGAYGLAGSHAGGLLAFLDEGSEVKRYHCGKAARDGLVSAELARRGLTGPSVVLESAHGYVNAFTGGDFKVDRLLDGLGTDWRMLDTYLKPYPCCRHVHGAIDAALELREHVGNDLTVITAIEVDTFAIAASHDRATVHNAMDAQMSLPYAVAVALVDGVVGVEQFDEAHRCAPNVSALAHKVEVKADDQMTAVYPRARPARVRIRTTSGDLVSEVSQPYGEPDHPMSDADLDAKFHRFVDPMIGKSRARRLAESVWTLDDAVELFACLGDSAPGAAAAAAGAFA